MSVEAWLDDFAACVRDRDVERARLLFDPACFSYGTRAEVVDGLDALAAEQWEPTWSTTHGFVFTDPTRTSASWDDTQVVVTSSWHSKADEDGRDRYGRCTIVLAREDAARHGFVAVHTHFSLLP